MANKAKSFVAKAIDVLATIVIILAVVVLVRVVFTGGGEAPSFGGYSVMRTLTGSMEPTIPENALVVVKETDPTELQVGDIITFKSTDPTLQGNYNTHRITSIHQEGASLYVRTKGDANNAEDQYSTPAANILGKVVWSSAVLGAIVGILTNPFVFFPLIVIPLVLIVVFEIRKALKAASAVADAEEEAALRAAVEELRKKRALEAEAQAKQAADVAGEGEGAVDATGVEVESVDSEGEPGCCEGEPGCSEGDISLRQD